MVQKAHHHKTNEAELRRCMTISFPFSQGNSRAVLSPNLIRYILRLAVTLQMFIYKTTGSGPPVSFSGSTDQKGRASGCKLRSLTSAYKESSDFCYLGQLVRARFWSCTTSFSVWPPFFRAFESGLN